MRIRPAHFPGAFYHVMLRGNRKQIIFQDDRDFRHLDRLVAESLDRYDCEVHAYCWMPNHLHLLMRAKEVPVFRSIHYFAMMYAKYFNFRYGLVGHLFQGRYKSRLVDSDGYFLQLLRYIHLNPVAGNLVDRAELYRWSSMQTYLNLANSPWVNQSVTLQYFARDRNRFGQFVDEDHDAFDPWASVDLVLSDPKDSVWNPSSRSATGWQNLDEIAAAACARFGTSMSDLIGSNTRRDLTLARCWIGREAVRGNVTTLSVAANYLRRSPAALSKSIKNNAVRLAKVKG